MSSQHREDKLHEIDDLLRRCHNEAVYQLLLDERDKLKRDLRHSTKTQHENRHRRTERAKSGSHVSSFDDIPDSKAMSKHGKEKKKAATLEPRMANSRDGIAEGRTRSKSRNEHRRAHNRTEASMERISKHTGSSEDKLSEVAKAERPKKTHMEHSKLRKATSESGIKDTKKEHKTQKSEKTSKHNNAEGTSDKSDHRHKHRKSKKLKEVSEDSSKKPSIQHPPDEVKEHKKAARSTNRKQDRRQVTEKQKQPDAEGKPSPPTELPIKEFTADEIEQMSKNHRAKLKPSYIQSTKDDSTRNKAKTPTSPTTPQPKAAMWREISPKPSKDEKSKAETKAEDSFKQPVIQTLRRGNDFNASSGSSTISSRLMKLKESDRKPNKKCVTPVNGVATHTERDVKSIPPMTATTKAPETRNFTAPNASKPRTKMHKLLRWQQSSPAVLEEEKRPPYLDIGNSAPVKARTIEKHSPKSEVEENQQVVFRVDLDELNRRNSKTRGFSSFIRQKVMRTRSGERRQTSTQECETQTTPWQIPALLLEQATQTAHIKVFSASTQTFTTGRCASTQTTVRQRDEGVQFQPRCFAAETQTTSSGVPSETQTEDEDSPVWGTSNRLSLDRLVRTRGRRKVKMKRASSHDEISTGSQEFDENPLKRATTLPHGGEKEGQKSKQKITSFDWTQTDKFIKIVISYSGAHLIPKENIKITTNGINLRLKINTEESTATNTNDNNNSNSSSGMPAELYISRLRYFVSGLSYTVQPDMLTVLLRKQKTQSWESLEYSGNTEKTVVENV